MACTECHRYHNGDHPFQGVGAAARRGAAELSLERFLSLADPQSSLAEAAAIRVFGTELPATENLLEMERAIDRASQQTAARLSLGDPLALDVVIGYLARKAAEVSNLRIIAHAKLLGISNDAVQQELVVV